MWSGELIESIMLNADAARTNRPAALVDQTCFFSSLGDLPALI